MQNFEITLAGQHIPVTPSLALMIGLEDHFAPLPVLLQQMQDKNLKLATQRDILKYVAKDSGIDLTDHDLEQHICDYGATGIARETVKILSALVAGIKAIAYFTGSEDLPGKPVTPERAV